MNTDIISALSKRVGEQHNMSSQEARQGVVRYIFIHHQDILQFCVAVRLGERVQVKEETVKHMLNLGVLGKDEAGVFLTPEVEYILDELEADLHADGGLLALLRYLLSRDK